MTSDRRRLLLGPSRSGIRRYVGVQVAIAVFWISFALYAVGWFETTGGVVFLPTDAAVLGLGAAGWVGYQRSGLVAAWLVAYGALLGPHADHAFLGLPRLTFPEQLTYFVRPDGLTFLAVEGLLVGTVAFVGGYLLRMGVDAIADARAGPPTG